MNKHDWKVAYDAMRDVFKDLDTHGQTSIFNVSATLENYPPRIMFTLIQNDEDMGLSSTQLLCEAADVIVNVCDRAISKYPWLKGNISNYWKSYSAGRWELLYELKPRRYKDIPGVMDKSTTNG